MQTVSLLLVFLRGSFATVKQAEHHKTGKLVAIKIMDRASENYEEREVCTKRLFS